MGSTFSNCVKSIETNSWSNTEPSELSSKRLDREKLSKLKDTDYVILKKKIKAKDVNLGFKSLGRLEISDAIMESDHEDSNSSTTSQEHDKEYIFERFDGFDQNLESSLCSCSCITEDENESSEYIEIILKKSFCSKMLSGNFIKICITSEMEA
ncbi:unnamed protein product [Moneuplotes crassus]|uniref:Uncharacterized protein n=1 Tax=Euplotes crassus TaxID=5936 RepID=A0AAD1Y7T6_EUPCR|nr:unnamed protein product [Moneuplotes crassus]